ncbi:MAG: nitrogenase iron-molybdenum cofactor biosynthesis protein NifN [Campylobacterota bacterium]
MELKPLSMNQLKHSQPMGAHLAFLGVDGCMPLMHGAQGCASFSKVFFTRHFCDPIAVQTTAVNDITAVIDGGEYSIGEAIKNITQKVQPQLIGLFTTGMTETKGDDIKGVVQGLKDTHKIVYANTPDFEGGLESGWAKAVEGMIQQLVTPVNLTKKKKLTLLPNVNMTSYEVEQLKAALKELGFEVFALPDMSTSMDGHLGQKQGALSSGGITVKQIENLGDSEAIISVGGSMKECGESFSKLHGANHFHFKSLSGLECSDYFYQTMLAFVGTQKPPQRVQLWRKRLQDAMLDTHFVLGSNNIVIALEPDGAYAVEQALSDAGATCEVITSQRSSYGYRVGDFEDVQEVLNNADALITNFHGHRICKENKKVHILRGFPNYEEIGNQLKSDILYEGSARLLFETANAIKLSH